MIQWYTNNYSNNLLTNLFWLNDEWISLEQAYQEVLCTRTTSHNELEISVVVVFLPRCSKMYNGWQICIVLCLFKLIVQFWVTQHFQSKLHESGIFYRAFIL